MTALKYLSIACVAAGFAIAPLPDAVAWPKPYDGELVFEGEWVSSWRFYPASLQFGAGPQPDHSFALDDGKATLAIVSLYLSPSDPARDRALGERLQADTLVGKAQTVVTNTPDGEMKIRFQRHASSNSFIYLAPYAATGSRWAFCSINLIADRGKWPSVMPMSFAGCRNWLAQVAGTSPKR